MRKDSNRIVREILLIGVYGTVKVVRTVFSQILKF